MLNIVFVGKHGGCLVESGNMSIDEIYNAIWAGASRYNMGNKTNWLVLENCVRAIGRFEQLPAEIKLSLISEAYAAFTGRGNF